MQAPLVDGKSHSCRAGNVVPMDVVVRKDWREAVVDERAASSASRTSCAYRWCRGKRSGAGRYTSKGQKRTGKPEFRHKAPGCSTACRLLPFRPLEDPPSGD